MSTDENGDSGRSITLSKIIAYLGGALFILAGLGAAVESPVGVFMLLGGLFALPPVRRRISDQFDVTMSRWVVVVVVIVLVGVGATALPSSTSEQATNPTNGGGGATTPAQTSTPADSTPANTRHEIGESFTVGSGAESIQYEVTNVQTTDSVGSDAVGEEADGIFLVIELRMKNVGDESLDLSSRPFRVVDSQDREFETDTAAMAYVENSIVFEQLNPGLEKQGVLVFDVPAGATFRLRIDPAGMFSGAESHFVTIGTVE